MTDLQPATCADCGADAVLVARGAYRCLKHRDALPVCQNCGQWQRPENGGDCFHECAARGFAPYADLRPNGRRQRALPASAWTFDLVVAGHLVEVEVHDADPEQPDLRLFSAVGPWRRRRLTGRLRERLIGRALDRLPEEWRNERAARREDRG